MEIEVKGKGREDAEEIARFARKGLENLMEADANIRWKRCPGLTEHSHASLPPATCDGFVNVQASRFT